MNGKKSQAKKNWLVGLFLALPMVFFFSLVCGPALSSEEVLQYLFGKEVSPLSKTILEQIRFPRILLAFLVGAGLSASGAVLQALLQNPLAEPYTLGISGGAAFGVTLGMLTMAFFSSSLLLLPLWGFGGAALATGLVYLMARQKNYSTTGLILGGVIINFLFSSLVTIFLLLLPANFSQSALFLLVGNLSSVDTSLLFYAAPFLGICLSFLFYLTPQINLLALGEEKAASLGANPRLLVRLVFWLSSAITGICVSLGGMIGFIGLLVPHFFRLFLGSDLVVLLPASALGGGMVLVGADTMARTLFFPTEIPVGAITGVIGGFVFLLFLSGKKSPEQSLIFSHPEKKE